MSWVDFIPFLVGAAATVTWEMFVLYDMVWKQRHLGGKPWNYSEPERVWRRLKDVAWPVIIVAPLGVGAVVQMFWWGMAVAMEVLR